MPNAQVVTEGFPLHALGLNYSFQTSLLPAGIVTYKISVLLTDNPKPVFHVRCFFVFFPLYYKQRLGVQLYFSLYVDQHLSLLHTLFDGFVDVHSRCFLSLVNSSSCVFHFCRPFTLFLLSSFFRYKSAII